VLCSLGALSSSFKGGCRVLIYIDPRNPNSKEFLSNLARRGFVRSFIREYQAKGARIRRLLQLRVYLRCRACFADQDFVGEPHLSPQHEDTLCSASKIENVTTCILSCGRSAQDAKSTQGALPMRITKSLDSQGLDQESELSLQRLSRDGI
jgi:hypothetical protein